MYLNWQLWTLLGLLFGAAFPGLKSLGLDFAMVATFIAIVVPQLVAVRFVAAALASGVLSFAWQGWPYKLGLLAAVFVGVAVGMLLTLMENRPQAKGHAKHRLKNAKERTQ
jgi:predicted branched-subunit amino acid permease